MQGRNVILLSILSRVFRRASGGDISVDGTGLMRPKTKDDFGPQNSVRKTAEDGRDHVAAFGDIVKRVQQQITRSRNRATTTQDRKINPAYLTLTRSHELHPHSDESTNGNGGLKSPLLRKAFIQRHLCRY